MRTINIRSVLAVLLTAICVCAKGQTAAQNYVKAETSVNDNGGKVTSVEYYDGLGRPVLTVTNGQGSNYVYQRRRYDYGDRISEQYIPAYGNTQPLYKDSTALNWLYSSDPYKSTHTTYDGLGRQTVVKGPGKLWHDNSRYVTTAYGLNAASEVRLYKVSGNSLTLSGYYAAGTLSVEQVTDENKHVTKIYKDMQDRVVLECRNSSYYTYYVYDYLGNLRYVLPPLAADALTATSTTWSSSTAAIKRYGYYYEYDSRNRCTKKQLPGCDYVTMTYDTCDRLTGSQDGNQRQSNTSTYYEYDNLGRQKVMGTKDASGTKTPLIETFYDDYSFLTTAESNKVGFHTSNGYESSKADAKGLQTGSRVHQLGSPSTYTVTAMYYNSYGEMIQSRSTNHRSGNDDQYVQYNHLTGKELKRKHIHSASSQTTRTEIYSYEYNASDQLKTVKHKLDNNAEKVLYTLTYDNYGRVSNKSVMGNKESIAFQYNIRDWLTNIGSTRFTEQIAYNATNGNAVPSTACYNGNIAAISWKAGSETAFRTAKFTYNNLDWLTGSTYSGTGKYTTSYTYDKMGNIKTIQRNGLQDGSTYGLIDNLTFTYTGNQVTKIEDAVNDPTYNGAFNFNDGVSQSGEYAYDQNGNLTKDLNKKISSIKYNFLNLPSSITYSTGKSATYIYDASGMKLRTSYKASSSATAQPTDYCGNMIYENNVLKQILIDGGYITFNGSTPVYHYYLQDHQGNNRVVCNASGTVEQVNHYYPFGGLYGQSTNGDTQHFKYNGKELDRMHGLDLYDYGARHYDAAIGRFTTIDPMAEKYYHLSPYVYCANNPVNRIDPDGCDWNVSINIDENGVTHYIFVINGVLYNNSSDSSIDMQKLQSLITEQIESTFTFSGENFDVSMTANIRVVDDVDDINKTDHVFQVVDQNVLQDAGENVLADADKNGLNVRLGTKLVGDILTGNNLRTIAHEVGHTGGLEHTLSNTNLMTQTATLQRNGVPPGPATGLKKTQIESIVNLYKNGSLNQRSPITYSFGFKLEGFSTYAPCPILRPILRKKLRKK